MHENRVIMDENSYSHFGIASFVWSKRSGHTILCALLFTGCIAWLVWRLWMFKLRHRANPDEPKQLPYSIPFLGHALGFASNPQAVFNTGRDYFGHDGCPYAMTVAGQTFYVITDPRDFGVIYRNSGTFTFNPLVEQVYRAFQLPEISIQRLFNRPLVLNGKPGIQTSPTKHGIDLSHDMITVEMRNSQSHNDTRKVEIQIDKMLSLDAIRARFSTTHDASGTSLSLYRLCSVVIASASQAAYFGDAVSTINSTVPEIFADFDRLCGEIFLQPPIFWSAKMKALKSKLLSTFEAYCNTPLEQRADMPTFLRKWELECRGAGLPSSDLATLLLIQYFGLNTNTPKACFWLMSHILFNPKLIQIIREETDAAFTSDSINYNVIKSSPHLRAIWLETLRLSATSLSFRHITEDFRLKNVVLRKGNQVALNPWPFHTNGDYFGPEPLQFDAERFITNEAYKQHPAFRPFGGGPPQCPGRQMAKQTTLIFIAYLFHRFDVELAWPQEFPKPSHKCHPGVAIMTPADGSDLVVRLKARKEFSTA